MTPVATPSEKFRKGVRVIPILKSLQRRLTSIADLKVPSTMAVRKKKQNIEREFGIGRESLEKFP
jgi:hypothetical protein